MVGHQPLKLECMSSNLIGALEDRGVTAPGKVVSEGSRLFLSNIPTVILRNATSVT